MYISWLREYRWMLRLLENKTMYSYKAEWVLSRPK